MKKFKLYGFINGNSILITNSDNISPASSYDETINIQKHLKATLSFKINDKISNSQKNPFIDLIYSGAKLRLVLENKLNSNLNTVIDFIITSINNEFYKDAIVYSISAEDLASVSYAKLGVNLSLTKTGTLKELVQEILAQTRANTYYLNASYNFISLSKYRTLNNCVVDLESGAVKSTILNSNNSISISFNKDKNLQINNNYNLYFYLLHKDADITLTISQYNVYGVLISENTYSTITLGLNSFIFIPELTLGYITLKFDSLVPNAIVFSDIKLYKELDTIAISNYLHLSDNFNEDLFIASTEDGAPISYSYYKKVTLSLNNSNLYNALIEVCNLFDAVLETNYNDVVNTFNFIPRTNAVFKGYRLSPEFNLSSISRSEDFSEFITALRISGKDNMSIYPSMPIEFNNYFNSCINTIEEAITNPYVFASGFNKYGTGIDELIFSDIAADIINLLTNDDQKVRGDIISAYAYACDKVPNFENVIYNIDYFNKIGKISNSDYLNFIDKIYNDLRILNIKINIFSSKYYTLQSELSTIENSINFNCQTINAESLNQYNLNKLLNTSYEYDNLNSNIVGANLLPNSDFESYGLDDSFANTYKVPSQWTMSSNALTNKPFIVDTNVLSDLNHPSIKFKDILSLPISDLGIYLDTYDIINIAPTDELKHITVSSYVYLDENFSGYFPKMSIIYSGGASETTTTSDFSNLYSGIDLIKKQWIRVNYTTTATIPVGTTWVQFTLGVHTPVTRNSEISTFYYSQPQLEIRNFTTDWNNEPISFAGTTGVNLLIGTNLDGVLNTAPIGWTNQNNGTFVISNDYLNDNKNSLKFVYSSTLSNESYIAANYINLNKYQITNRAITFSGYIYKPSNKTLDLPLYLSIKTYDINKNFISELNKEFITSANIGLNDTWIRFNRTFTIPTNSNIAYIRPFIGYYKTSTSGAGNTTDLVYLSLLQLEFGYKATPWAYQYDLDGTRYSTYKFILDGHKFVSGDLVQIQYYTEDTYAANLDKYPCEIGSYYIVQANSTDFKLSKTLGGDPIVYNENYISSNSNLWKLSGTDIQAKTTEWITVKNSIADSEDAIQNATLQNFDLMNIVYNEYYEPIRIALENNDLTKIKIGSFLDKLITIYGYENINWNGLQLKIDELLELIKVEKNSYDVNKTLIYNLILELNETNLTDYIRYLKETEKAGYLAENDNKKFTIGIFTDEQKVLDNNHNVIMFNLAASDADSMYKNLVINPEFDITGLNFTGKYVRINSVDGKDSYLKYIIYHTDGVLTIEYFPKENKIYNIYIVDLVEDFNSPIVNGIYQTKLYFYNIIRNYLNSYTYEKSLLDYSLWSLYYKGEDRSARISQSWDYLGNALITYQDYGNQYYDYMVKLDSNSTLIAIFDIPEESTYDIKTLYKVINLPDIPSGSLDIQIENSYYTSDVYSTIYSSNSWQIVKTTSDILPSGTYKLYFINNSNYDIYIYRPAVVTEGALISNEQLFALYDNPQTTHYIETAQINISPTIGLYDILINLNSSYNLIAIKNKFLGELYNDYKNYLFEGYYDNNDEIDTFGLLEQGLINSEKFRIPKIVFNTSVIDLSALDNYRYLDIKVGDKIIIAEPEDRLYKSYSNEENKYLLISEIAFNLRQMESTSITVERDNSTKILVQKLLKNII